MYIHELAIEPLFFSRFAAIFGFIDKYVVVPVGFLHLSSDIHVVFFRSAVLCRAIFLTRFTAIFGFIALIVNWLDPTFKQTELDPTFRLNILSVSSSLLIVLTVLAHVVPFRGGFLFLQLG